MIILRIIRNMLWYETHSWHALPHYVVSITVPRIRSDAISSPPRIRRTSSQPESKAGHSPRIDDREFCLLLDQDGAPDDTDPFTSELRE